MNGGAGTDLLDFSEVAGNWSFTLGDAGAGTATLSGTDTYQNIEGVIGSIGANTLVGNAGNNVLRGGGGNDILDGGAGIDLLDFSDATSAIGTASASFILQQGTNAASGSNGYWNAGPISGIGADSYKNMEGVIGSKFDDFLSGGIGNDVLIGGGGADVLSGGAGQDTFVFNTAPNAVVQIQDFSASGVDSIELSASMFSNIAAGANGTLLAADFVGVTSGGASADVAADVNIIYDSGTGNLYYDTDGGSNLNRTLFAHLTIQDGGTFDNNDIKVGS